MALIDKALSLEVTSTAAGVATDANGRTFIKLGHSDAGSGKPLYLNCYITRVGATHDHTSLSFLVTGAMREDMADAATLPPLGGGVIFADMPGNGLGLAFSIPIPQAAPGIADFGYLQFIANHVGGSAADIDFILEVGPRPQQQPRAAILPPIES